MIDDVNAKRMYDTLRRIQNDNLSADEIKEIVDFALLDTVEARMIDSPTNSPIGCQHWFNTLLGNIAHIGEFMQKHELTEEQRQGWGKQLEQKSRHLIDNYGKIPFKY